MNNVVHLHQFVIGVTVNGLKSRPYGFSDAEAPARFILSLLETYEEVYVQVFVEGVEVFWQIVGDQIVTKQKIQARSI